MCDSTETLNGHFEALPREANEELAQDGWQYQLQELGQRFRYPNEARCMMNSATMSRVPLEDQGTSRREQYNVVLAAGFEKAAEAVNFCSRTRRKHEVTTGERFKGNKPLLANRPLCCRACDAFEGNRIFEQYENAKIPATHDLVRITFSGAGKPLEMLTREDRETFEDYFHGTLEKAVPRRIDRAGLSRVGHDGQSFVGRALVAVPRGFSFNLPPQFEVSHPEPGCNYARNLKWLSDPILNAGRGKRRGMIMALFCGTKEHKVHTTRSWGFVRSGKPEAVKPEETAEAPTADFIHTSLPAPEVWINSHAPSPILPQEPITPEPASLRQNLAPPSAEVGEFPNINEREPQDKVRATPKEAPAKPAKSGMMLLCPNHRCWHEIVSTDIVYENGQDMVRLQEVDEDVDIRPLDYRASCGPFPGEPPQCTDAEGAGRPDEAPAHT